MSFVVVEECASYHMLLFSFPFLLKFVFHNISTLISCIIFSFYNVVRESCWVMMPKMVVGKDLK